MCVLHHLSPCTGGLDLSLNTSSDPVEQDNVALRCTADRLLYSNLTWYRVQSKNMSSTTPVLEAQSLPAATQPCSSLPQPLVPLQQAAPLREQGGNITLELVLTNTSREDEGLYVCRVESLTNRLLGTCLLRYLSVRGEGAKMVY